MAPRACPSLPVVLASDTAGMPVGYPVGIGSLLTDPRPGLVRDPLPATFRRTGGNYSRPQGLPSFTGDEMTTPRRIFCVN